MDTQVRYKAGNFVTYTATRTFSAVDRAEGVVQLQHGEEVEYDGYTLRYGGEDIKAPNLRSAVKANWLVPEGFEGSVPVPVAPRRTNVFAGGSVLDSDERIVSNHGERTAGVLSHNKQVGRAHVVMESGDDGVVIGSGGFKVKAGSARNQPGVDMSTTGTRAIQELTSYQRRGVAGLSQDEYLEKMDPSQREEYLDKIETRKASILVAANLAPPEKKAKREKKPGQDLPSADKETKIEKDGTLDARKVVAKALCQDFPDTYDFGQQWKKRLANIRFNFEDRPDVIRAIFAAESDDFKKVLLAEFPEVFEAGK